MRAARAPIPVESTVPAHAIFNSTRLYPEYRQYAAFPTGSTCNVRFGPLLLISSIAVLGVAVVVGTWLAGKYVMLEQPPITRWPGLLHGVLGVIGFVLLDVALSLSAPTAKAVRLGAAKFGLVASVLVTGALLVGALILLAHGRRRLVPIRLVAVHGLLGIAGYTLLVTYLTMLH